MSVKRRLTYFTDPGHGWLSVSHRDLLRLGIAHEISHFSYMNATRAFLEEDRDAGIFLDAAKARGWDIDIRNSYYENCFIRSLASYNPYFVENPLQAGSRVIIGREMQATIIHISKDGIYLNADTGGLYRVPYSNPFRYIQPPREAVEVIA